MSHGCQEVASANPQQRDRDPGDKGRAQAKRAVGTWQGRWDDVLGVVHCRVQQHDEQQAPVGARIEPRHGDGQRGHLQHVHEERLSKGVGLGNEELRQVPAGPEEPEQNARAREAEARGQAGERIAAPADLLARLEGCRKRDGHRDEGPRLAATGAWPRLGSEAWSLIPVAVAFSTPFQAGEEIGWRGYALPCLATRFGLARASVLLGLLWACWHLPQFFIPEADTFGQSFFVYVLQVTALSVAMAWLYARTNGSLLLIMLLHSAVNNAKDIVPSALPGAKSTFGLSASLVAWLTVTLLWIGAGYFLTTMRHRAERLE